MTNEECSLLELLIEKPYPVSEFISLYLSSDKSQRIFLSLFDRKYIDFNQDEDAFSVSIPGKIAYQRHVGQQRDSFKEWFNRSFILGTVSGIIVGVITTLLSTYLLGLLHL